MFTEHPLDSYLEERNAYLHELIDEQSSQIWEDFEKFIPDIYEKIAKYEDEELYEILHKTVAFIFSRLAALMLINNYETQRLVLENMETEGEEQ